jgi:hypothetical protein
MFFVRLMMILVRDLAYGAELAGNSAPKCPRSSFDLRFLGFMTNSLERLNTERMQAVGWVTC